MQSDLGEYFEAGRAVLDSILEAAAIMAVKTGSHFDVIRIPVPLFERLVGFTQGFTRLKQAEFTLMGPRTGVLKIAGPAGYIRIGHDRDLSGWILHSTGWIQNRNTTPA